MPLVPINTGNSMSMVADYYQPRTPWPVVRKLVHRLPEAYSFDLSRLLSEFNELENTYGLRPFQIQREKGKIRRSYRGLGVTYRPESQDPLYDALRQYSAEEELDISQTFEKQRMSIRPEDRKVQATYELNFSLKNQLYKGYLATVLDKFKSPLTKVRFSELGPRGLLASHVDFPYYEQIRVHAVLKTNDQAWWSVDGKEFQIPADGSFYWFDTGKYHGVWNDGKSPRLVLSVNLSVYKDRDGRALYGPGDELIDLIDRAQI